MTAVSPYHCLRLSLLSPHDSQASPQVTGLLSLLMPPQTKSAVLMNVGTLANGSTPTTAEFLPCIARAFDMTGVRIAGSQHGEPLAPPTHLLAVFGARDRFVSDEERDKLRLAVASLSPGATMALVFDSKPPAFRVRQLRPALGLTGLYRIASARCGAQDLVVVASKKRADIQAPTPDTVQSALAAFDLIFRQG